MRKIDDIASRFNNDVTPTNIQAQVHTTIGRGTGSMWSARNCIAKLPPSSESHTCKSGSGSIDLGTGHATA